MPHVGFQPEEVSQHDNQIIVEPPSDNEHRYVVHLGFLQIDHEYEVMFNLNHNLGEEVEVCANPTSLQIRVNSAELVENGHNICVSLTARQEQLMIQEIQVTNIKERSKTFGVLLKARVLGHGKGTPLLRSGIHCVKKFDESISDASGWEGFK